MISVFSSIFVYKQSCSRTRLRLLDIPSFRKNHISDKCKMVKHIRNDNYLLSGLHKYTLTVMPSISYLPEYVIFLFTSYCYLFFFTFIQFYKKWKFYRIYVPCKNPFVNNLICLVEMST